MTDQGNHSKLFAVILIVLILLNDCSKGEFRLTRSTTVTAVTSTTPGQKQVGVSFLDEALDQKIYLDILAEVTGLALDQIRYVLNPAGVANPFRFYLPAKLQDPSISIHSKPTEAILKSWFTQLQG